MNNDSISREALKKALEEDMKYGGVKTDEFDKGYDLGIKTAIEMLDNAPTVEPFERIGSICEENCGYNPQGEWVRKEDVIHSIAKQYSEHNELVPIWLSIGDMKGDAE